MPSPDCIRVAVSGTLDPVGCYHLGIAVLRDTFATAALGLLGKGTGGTWYTLPRPQVVAEAVAFVKGSGLDILLETWGLSEYNEDVRGAFEVWLQRRKSPS